MDFYIRTLFVTALVVTSLTWLVFFSVKMLSSHTDIGQSTKAKKKKKKKIENSDDNLPMFAINDFQKPKIETSFGDSRIGDVHESSE